MPRLEQLSTEQANAEQAELFATVKSKLGRVPNILKAMGNSPTALRGYLGLSGALSKGGSLDPKQREIIALTVAEASGCEYCLAAHSTVGKMVGLSPEAIEAARRGDGIDDSARALAQFTTSVLEARGRVSDEQLDAFYAAGFDPAAVTEVLANIALSLFTNYFNNLAETDVDFPAAAPLSSYSSN